MLLCHGGIWMALSQMIPKYSLRPHRVCACLRQFALGLSDPAEIVQYHCYI